MRGIFIHSGLRPAPLCIRRGRARVAMAAVAMCALLCAFVCVFVFATPSATLAQSQAAAQTARVEGTVKDASGAPVQGAEVDIHAPDSFDRHIRTDANGAFAFDGVPVGSGIVDVTLSGFNSVSHPWSTAPGTTVRLDLTLAPEVLNQKITVTANRAATLLADVPASNIQFTSDDLHATPALTLDDDLRQVPGFSLFRRSSSRTANPTTQGVSLRGLGADATSRALVLADGIPLNDPFGGWVYWDRVPLESIASVEIAQEGSSSLYGSDALGGVVQILTKPVTPAGISLETSYGNQNTPEYSMWAGGETHGWFGAVAGEYFRTDGYVLTPEAFRGSVDTAAASDHGTVDATVGRKFGMSSSVFASGSYLNESRNNGTMLQTNDTAIGEGVLGANVGIGKWGSLSARVYGEAETYHQSLSSIASGRNSESLTDLQTVPAQGVGSSVVWSVQVKKRLTIVAGVDDSENFGVSQDHKYAQIGTPPVSTNTTDIFSGGKQRTVGVFGEDLIQITPKWLLSLSGRVDHWSNFDATSTTFPITPPGPVVVAPFDSRSDTAFSPRLTLLHQMNSNVSWTFSAYRSFRAPTLNELYRTSRVGNKIIQSNPDLIAEHLSGGEAGITVSGWSQRIQVRGVVFYNQIVDPIANVTTSVNTTTNTITTTKENLGRTNAPGFEIDSTFNFTHNFLLTAGYQYVDTKVSSYPAPAGGVSLVGLWVAQVPHNSFTFQARYDNPRWVTVSVAGRAIGKQYDDDQNVYPLGSFFVLDAQVSRIVGAGFQIYGAVENLFNEKYATAATPVEQLGLPIVGRIGFRWQLPRK
jgi:outer membrane receptor protein involved in Fe transport